MENTFWQDAPSGGDNKLTLLYAVNSQYRTQLELFIQEIIQNPKDAVYSKSEKCPHVNFRIVFLEGGEKKSFLDSFNWFEHEVHIDSINNKKTINYKTYKELMDQKYLCLLYVEDYNTLGLIGPEDTDEYSDETKCFAGVFSRGTSEKSGPSSGGTNGYGKAVMYIFSGIKTFVAFSKLSQKYFSRRYSKENSQFKARNTTDVDKALNTDYTNNQDTIEVSYRLMGETAYPQHTRPNKTSSKIGFLHYSMPRPTDSDIPLPFINQDAQRLASNLLFTNRNDDSNIGTTFLIVDFLDRDQDDQEINTSDKAKSILTKIHEACVKLYWPAISDKKITISTQFNDEVPIFVDLDKNKAWESHINLYNDYKNELIKNKNENQDIQHKWMLEKDIIVPKRPAKLHAVFDTKIENKDVSAKIVSIMGFTNEKEKSKLVTFRGSRQIIEIINLEKDRRSNGSYPYGIVLLGNIISTCNINEDIPQSFLEQLISISEPVAHDKLDPSSENMRNHNWPSSKARINDINNWIKGLGKYNESIDHQGTDAAPDLAKLFSFLKGGETKTDECILQIIDTQINKDVTGYNFAFTLRVPAQSKSKYTHWSVVPKLNIASKTNSIELPTFITKIGSTTLDEPKEEYSDKFNQRQSNIKLIGRTDTTIDYGTQISLKVVTKVGVVK